MKYICHVCQAEIVFTAGGGEPLIGKTNGEPTVWCDFCADDFAWACEEASGWTYRINRSNRQRALS